LLACTAGDDYDNPKNRILVLRNKSFLEFGTSGEAVISIDATAQEMGYILGENGTVVEFDWRNLTQDSLKESRVVYANPSVSDAGPLRRIRIINGEIFCAGSAGQMYHLQQGQFINLPVLKFGEEALTIEDFAGTNSNDLIAVTSDGYGALFNGSDWTFTDLPSRVSFSSICSLPGGSYAIAGIKGTIIIGQNNSWSAIDPIDPKRNYWGIAPGNNVVYAAHSGGIDVLEGNKLYSMTVPAADKNTYTSLGLCKEGVLSCAGQTIGIIKKDGWHTLISNQIE